MSRDFNEVFLIPDPRQPSSGGRIFKGSTRLGYWILDDGYGPKGSILLQLDDLEGRSFSWVYVNPKKGESRVSVRNRAERRAVHLLKKHPRDDLSWIDDIPTDALGFIL